MPFSVVRPPVLLSTRRIPAARPHSQKTLVSPGAGHGQWPLCYCGKQRSFAHRPSPIYGRDGPLTSELRDTRPETQIASRPVPVNIYRNRAGSVLTHTAPCRRRWNAQEHFAAGPRCEKSCYSSYRSTIRARISETHPSGSFSTSFSQK